MRVNVCVNGTFRYPQYIRHYEAAGVLNAFYYAHRRATTAACLGLVETPCLNVWAKEYLLHAVSRGAPSALVPRLSTVLGDMWQSAVVRHWRDCDTLEAVIGAVADRVIAFAKARGSRVLGHPVTSHPGTVARLVGRAYDDLKLRAESAALPDLRRRLDEIAACDRLVVDSAFVARSYVEQGYPAERIAVVRPGVDRLRFHPRSLAELDRQRFSVVCVGTITPRKGQHVLLEAWRKLDLPNAELILIGPLGRHASAVIHGHEGAFTHRPRVNNAGLRALLVRASAFVMPSVEDGFAQAPLEAMACGLPVIVTDNTGMADGLTEGQDGFVIPAFDAAVLAERIERLYRNQALAEHMGEQAARTAHRSAAWDTYVDRILDQHRMLHGGACEGRAA